MRTNTLIAMLVFLMFSCAAFSACNESEVSSDDEWAAEDREWEDCKDYCRVAAQCIPDAMRSKEECQDACDEKLEGWQGWIEVEPDYFDCSGWQDCDKFLDCIYYDKNKDPGSQCGNYSAEEDCADDVQCQWDDEADACRVVSGLQCSEYSDELACTEDVDCAWDDAAGLCLPATEGEADGDEGDGDEEEDGDQEEADSGDLELEE